MAEEFYHILEGRCARSHESDEAIEIEANTPAFFPGGWKGTCRVKESIRKVYMMRQGTGL